MCLQQIFRLILVLVIPFLLVYELKYLTEFSGQLDMTDVSKGIVLSSKNPVWTPEIGNQLFKVATKIDAPIFYQVSVANDVFVYLEATEPKKTPAPTIIKIGGKEIQFQKKELIEGFIQINNAAEAQQYLARQTIEFRPVYENKILLGPNAMFKMVVDSQHKTVNFLFEIHPLIEIILYILFLFGVYPLLISIKGVWRFISKGAPFIDRS